MPNDDALDLAVARHVTQTGMATPVQLQQALQEQARQAAAGAPVSLSQALVNLGVITPTQRETVEQKVQGGVAQQLSHYRLVKKLGEGGMGAVYLAEDARDGRKVAVKVLPRRFAGERELLTRFRREADAAAQLDHPNIVRAWETGEDLGWHFYVMEYCEGYTLDTHLKAESRLDVPRALDLALQVARGLQFAHSHGVIHRDIKPANVIVARNGAAKILDLGLSKNLEESGLSFRTVSGAVLGTPHYISPEQAEGRKDIDGRTDLYSLGATLYHLITGVVPFSGSTAVEIIYKHVHEQIPDPRDHRDDIPEGVVHVLRRMMAKKPGDRYPDAGELILDLETVRKGGAPRSQGFDPSKSSVAVARKRAVPTGTRRIPVVRRPRKSPALVWGIAGGIVAVVGLVVIAFSGGPPPQPPPAPVKPPPPKLVQPPTPTPPPVAADPWKDAPDLLGLVDPARDAVAGTWTRGLQGLAVEAAAQARVEIPYVPPDEYDLRVAFTRRDGKDDVVLVLSHWGKAFTFQLGGAAAGFSVGGAAPKGPSVAVENGREHVAVVEVRGEGLRALLDGKVVSELRTDYGNLSIEAGWKLRDATILGLGCRGGSASFHKAELRTVRGVGREAIRATPASAFDAVLAELIRANPGFEARKARPKIVDGKVVELALASATLKDLGPLRALVHLEALDVGTCGVADLSPLRGMRLKSLAINHTIVADLSPLAGMPLSFLNIEACRVQDLSPLKGAPLADFRAPGTPIVSLEPLQDCPLARIVIDYVGPRDGGILRSQKTLQSINGLPPQDFWKRLAETSPPGGGELRRLLGHRYAIYSVSVSPDGRRALTGGGDDTLRYWDLESGRELAQLRCKESLYATAFSPDGTRAYGAGVGKSVVVWDPEGRKVPTPIEGHMGEIRGLAASRDGRLLATTASDKTVRVWDVATSRERRRWEMHAEGRSVAFSPDGRRVAAAGLDQAVWIWSVEGSDPPRVLKVRKGPIHALAFASDGRRILFGGYRHLGVVDGEREARTWTPGGIEDVRAVAWSPDGRRILFSGSDGVLRLADPESGAVLETFSGHADQVRSLAFAPDGKRAVSASYDWTVRVWTLEEKPWRPLFDGKTPDFARNPAGWKVEGGALTRIPGPPNAMQTKEEFDDCEFRVRFEQRGVSSVFFAARQSMVGHDYVFLDKVMLMSREDRPLEVRILCRGGDVTATLDGKPLPVQHKGDRSPRGCLQFNASEGAFRLLSLDVR